MKNSYGFNFVLVSDVQQVLDPKIFHGGPWQHVATIRRGLKEYVAFRHIKSNKLYLEELDEHSPTVFNKIEDDREWADLYRFLDGVGLLTIGGVNKEIKCGPNGLPGFSKAK